MIVSPSVSDRVGEWRQHVPVLALPFALIMVSSWLLVQDFRRADQGAAVDDIPLATIKSAKGDVKRKANSRLVWNVLINDSPVFKRDSVRTTAESEAVIIFPDGAEITIGENSMIVLEQSKDRLAIEFVSGSLITKGGGKGILLKSQGMEINTADAKVELSAKAGGAASLNVKDGTVSVESAEGKKITIAQNQKADLDQGSMGEITDIPISLTLPAENALILSTRSKHLMDFAWTSTRAVGESRLEVATDRDFKEIKKALSATGRESVVRVGLAPGTYYWRIAGAVGSKGTLSTTSRFEIAQKTPVRVVDPVDKSSYRHGKKIPRITFSWLGPDYYDQYQVEVSADPEFKKFVAKSERGASTQATLEIDHAGELFWRIVATSSRSDSTETTGSRTFQIRKVDGLEPPRLIAPKSGESVATGKSGEAAVPFKWSSLEDAGSYRLELSRQADFKDILTDEDSTIAEYTWNTKELGRFYWRVTAITPEGEKTAPSAGAEFVILSGAALAQTAPLDKQTFEYLTEIPKISLEWESDKRAEKYEIEVALDYQFTTQMQKLQTDDTNVAPKNLADGTWFWRVRAIDEHKTPYRSTGTRSFELKAKELLAAPQLILPAPDLVRDSIIPDDVEIEFTWENIKDAQAYELIIRRRVVPGTPPDANAEKSQRFNDNRGRITKLESGEYEWGVRAVDRHGRPGKIGRMRALTIRYDELALLKPQIITPEEGASKFEAPADGMGKETVLSWEVPSPPKNNAKLQPASFEVYFKGASGTKVLKTNDPALALNQLPRGKHEWSVRALTSDGRRGPASEMRQIDVREPAKIPKPTIFPVVME